MKGWEGESWQMSDAEDMKLAEHRRQRAAASMQLPVDAAEVQRALVESLQAAMFLKFFGESFG